MSAENEAALDAGNEEGREKTDDTESVQHPAKKINGIAAPPAGYGFENDQLVPVEVHSTLMPEPDAPTELDELARSIIAMSRWVHEDRLSLRWTCAFVALGQGQKSPAEIAAEFGYSTRRVEQLIAEARAVLAELRGKAVPTKGDQP